MPARCAGHEYFLIQDLRPVMSMCRVNIRKDLTQMALLGLAIALVLSTVISLSVRRISPLQADSRSHGQYRQWQRRPDSSIAGKWA